MMNSNISCVGSVCGDNKISSFCVDNDLCIKMYKSFTPPNIQCVINAINYHPERDQLLCAATNGIFAIDSKMTNQIHQDFDFENKPISTNISCITSNDQWFGYSTKNIMNVISWNSLKSVTTKKHKEHFNAISFIANRYIIGGDIKGEILIHNVNSHLLSTSFNGYINQNGINCIDVTKNRINWFIASNDNGFNYLFDITREKMIYYDYTHSSPSNQCAFNPIYSSLFISCGLDKQILVHDVNRKKIGIKLEAKAPLSCIQYIPESDKYIICCSTNGDIYLYDLRKFNYPIQEIKTKNCILGLDIHQKIKFDDIHINKINQNIQETAIETAIESPIESPISSAVAYLPEYMNQKFGKISIQQNQIKHKNVVNDTNDLNVINDINDIVVNDVNVTNNSDDTKDTNNSTDINDTNDTKDNNNNDDSKTDDILEEKIRKIVKEEIEISENRVMKEICNLFHQLHSDLIEQFITNEISTEKNIEKLFELMTQFKNQNETLQNDLKYAKF